MSDLISDCVEIADSVTKDLGIQVDVIHIAWTSEDVRGKITPASPVTRKAIVIRTQKLVTRLDGQESVSQSTIYFLETVLPNGSAGRREPIDERDQLILPDGSTGPILAISGLINPDTSFPYTIEVNLG